MDESKIILPGIFSEGYGIIPKKLMKMKFGTIKLKTGKKTVTVKGCNIKLIMSYMLSYTGKGIDCFPKIKTIAEDLEISQETVMHALSVADEMGLISKSRLFPDSPMRRHNKYSLDFLENGLDDIKTKTEKISYSDGTRFRVSANESINNNSINNNSININGLSKKEPSTGEDICPNPTKQDDNVNPKTKVDNNQPPPKEGSVPAPPAVKLGEVAQLYPARCPVKNRSLKRSSYNRKKLTALIKERGIENVKETIKAHIADCVKTGTWLENFATLVNNFPDLEDYKGDESRDDGLQEF